MTSVADDVMLLRLQSHPSRLQAGWYVETTYVSCTSPKSQRLRAEAAVDDADGADNACGQPGVWPGG